MAEKKLISVPEKQGDVIEFTPFAELDSKKLHNAVATDAAKRVAAEGKAREYNANHSAVTADDSPAKYKPSAQEKIQQAMNTFEELSQKFGGAMQGQQDAQEVQNEPDVT